MHRRLAILLALLTSLALAAPAGAITSGQADAGEHPYVGQPLFFDADAQSPAFDDPGSWFSCSGIGVGLDGESTTTGGGDGSGGNDIWVTFSEEADFEGFPPSSDYERDENQQRYQDRAAWANANPEWIRGTSFPHPEFADAPFFVHDAGVVVLDEPVALASYGAVASHDWLEQYATQRGPSHRLFEPVGYGLTASGPFTSEGGDIRLKGDVKLNTLRGSVPPDTYALFSNNPGQRATSGTCFGDSGGPIFDNTDSNLVVAVTSFGFSLTCSGVGGGYRIDQPDDLAFLATFGITP